MSRLRSIQSITPAPLTTEGEGVSIHRAFPNYSLSELDPFLLLDHMGPQELGPGEAKGFPDHPHRGFETVTYLLSGEFEHRDSFGHHGILRPGDVQWMRAGSGLVHSEVPGQSLIKNGGKMEGFQIWVNLPKRDKMKAPHYQELSADRIPSVMSADGKVEVKVIAGEALGVRGGVETHIPIQYLHLKLKPGAKHLQDLPKNLNAMLYVFAGGIDVNARNVPRFHLAALANDGDAIEFTAQEATQLLLLAGQPINEPVARYGPFVMNTRDELNQAFQDYRSGKMGSIAVGR
jgi:redox-sensitive bicupin YhaK (pirin superfamily)